MNRVLTHRLILTVLACFIALAGPASTRHMAPDADQVAQLELTLALGAPLAELCGDEHVVHDHRCPFCHLLPEAHRATFATHEARLVFALHDQLLRNLTAGAQQGLGHRLARAPPVTT